MTNIPTSQLHRLSDQLSAMVTDDGVTIYDTSGETPVIQATLDAGEMWGLTGQWLDGYCPICSTPINQGHYLCRICATKEARLWEGY